MVISIISGMISINIIISSSSSTISSGSILITDRFEAVVEVAGCVDLLILYVYRSLSLSIYIYIHIYIYIYIYIILILVVSLYYYSSLYCCIYLSILVVSLCYMNVDLLILYETKHEITCIGDY